MGGTQKEEIQGAETQGEETESGTDENPGEERDSDNTFYLGGRAESDTDKEQENVSRDGIDYDLTSMGSDMIYATVYQLMADPDSYTGKTIKMKGNYNATYYEPNEKYYFYCVIQDALACCAQGLEFIWDDGSHRYPEEYPEDNAEIIVTGIFETYREKGDENLYCRLKDATMEVVKK